MVYTVTFCVFDHTVEANFFWHGSFFLSKLDESQRLLEVVEAWGFYGVTSTSNRNSLSGKLKRRLALDVDFQGNHGMLVPEEIRFMDLGHGLHGYTFELTQEKFAELHKRCADAVSDQEAAIKEVVHNSNLPAAPPSRKVRFYPQEPYSRYIYDIEQSNAQREGRPSRLKPFDFHLSCSFWGPSLEKSHTCKTGALSILEGVLTEEQLAPFRKSSLPRFIPGLEPILLHSTGPLRTHMKESGKKAFYRDRKDKDVKLYWSVPPKHLKTLSKGTADLLHVDDEYYQEVKTVVSKLQDLEWLLRNADLPEQFKNPLIEQVIACYMEFAVLKPKNHEQKISGWHGFALSLFSMPRNQNEHELQQKIARAKALFNSFYMAVVDDWELSSEASEIDDDHQLEYLALHLSREDKEKLCRIIGRNYSENERSSLSLGPM